MAKSSRPDPANFASRLWKAVLSRPSPFAPTMARAGEDERVSAVLDDRLRFSGAVGAGHRRDVSEPGNAAGTQGPDGLINCRLTTVTTLFGSGPASHNNIP